jgi:phage tail-like protein
MRVSSSWITVAVVGAMSLAVASPAAAQSDPISASRFSLVVDGVQIATFSELSGMSSDIEASEYWETKGDAVNVKKVAGKTHPPTVTLKRGMNGSLELWSWHEAVRTGSLAAARRSCSLVMSNAEGQVVARYWLEKAWPSKIELAGLKAGASEALMETVTLTAEYIQRVSP